MPSTRDQPKFAISAQARLSEVRVFASALQNFCLAEDVPEAVAIDLELALVEAANNIVEHSYADRDDGMMEMLLEVDANGITIELVDAGSALPANKSLPHTPVAANAESGRGLQIMQACVDKIEYATVIGRNRLRLFKALTRS